MKDDVPTVGDRSADDSPVRVRNDQHLPGTIGHGQEADPSGTEGRQLRTTRSEGGPIALGEVVGAQFRVCRLAAGYVRCIYREGAQLTGQDARDVLQAIRSLTDGRPTPLLVDLRVTLSVSREARKIFANSAVSSRTALFVASSLSRLLANFFIGVSHPSITTRMFSDLDAAQRWLLDDR